MSEDDSVLTRIAPPPQARIAYGSHAEQYALVWQGGAVAATRPLVLLLHGGYWRPAYDLAHMNSMAAVLAAEGWTVANVEYRRIPGHPEAMAEDLHLALQALLARTSPHNGRVLVVGFSAGGHLALWLAATHASLQAVVALAPVASLEKALQLRLSNDAVSEFLGSAATTLTDWDPEVRPDSQRPVFILHGDADDTVPLELSQRYVARHPHAQLKVLPHTGHYALIDPLSPAWPEVLAAMRRASEAA
jgi:acetyl esterase/lipase